MPNRMTISTPHSTLGNLLICLRDALGETDVDFLDAVDVVKVKRGSVRPVAAINASVGGFVVIEKCLDRLCPGFRLTIDPFPVSRLGKANLPPRLRLGRIVSALTRAAIRFPNFVGIALFPSSRCFSLPLHPRFVIHNRDYTAPYPCKPDIFEMTYEAVEE